MGVAHSGGGGSASERSLIVHTIAKRQGISLVNMGKEGDETKTRRANGGQGSRTCLAVGKNGRIYSSRGDSLYNLWGGWRDRSQWVGAGKGEENGTLNRRLAETLRVISREKRIKRMLKTQKRVYENEY